MLFATLLAAAASVSAGLVQRDANTVLNDIAQIKAQTIKINQTVASFQGDTLTALEINSQSGDLVNMLNQATSDASSSSAFSNADAASVVNAITALTPAIYDTLNGLVRKYPQFQTVVLGTSGNGIVSGDLTNIKNATDNFSAAVTPKFPSVLSRIAPFLVGNIDYHFTQAIAVFSS